MSTDVETVKSRLAKGYSRSAPLYDALAGHMYLTGIRRLLPRLRVPPYGAILDVGCGTGVNLLEAAIRYRPARLLCGIDLSPGMIEVARAKAAALGVPAQFTVGDAEQLPYPDGTFDLVICNSVYHWFKDRWGAVREMNRVLRPGGQLALICAAAPGFAEWFSLVDAILLTALGPAAPRSMPEFPTVAEVAAVMLDNGFLLEHLANPRHVQRIMNAEQFIRTMSIVAPHWSADLTDGQVAVVEEVAARLIRTGWPAGFPNTWAAVEAVGRKVM